MPFNLLTTPWIPIHRRDGSRQEITPDQLTTDLADNPVVALDAPRPDFNGALVQFLIGLLQTAFSPADRYDWFDHLETPPNPEVLTQAFSKVAPVFDLDGEDARFMQDQDPLAEQKPLPITALLIDTAGSETHFVKDLPQQGLSLAVAALALYTLQTNAPSGGVGHRTSLRGGGPLTTLVLATPDRPERAGDKTTLWQTLWLNVLDRETLGYDAEPPREDIFPWLRPTRTSEKGGQDTTPDDVHPLQMFWGMPRRIRLDLEQALPGRCALTGREVPGLVRSYRTKNYGTNYIGPWQHTLSPYTHDGKELLAMHPRGSINYRHWLSLVQGQEDKKVHRLPARVLVRFNSPKYRLARGGWRYRLWAFGYEMDNMKPRCWFESTLPLYHFADDERRRDFEADVKNMVLAAGELLDNLRNRLKDAWFSPNDPRRKKADTAFVQDAFWQETEPAFYERIDALAKAEDHEAARRATFDAWHRELKEYIQTAFDRWVHYNQITEQTHPGRIAAARRNLRLFSYSKKIRGLLDLPTKKKAA